MLSSGLAFKKVLSQGKKKNYPVLAATLDIAIRSLLQTHGDDTSVSNCIGRAHQIMS